MKKLLLAAMVGAMAMSGSVGISLGQKAPKAQNASKAKAHPAAIPAAKQFVTKHTGNFDGKKVSYTATAGDTYLRDKMGKPVATIFNYAYVKDNVKDPKTRPVSFIFNGGPGSPSMWLHMGVFGPKLVKVPSNADADDGAAPYNIVDNVETLLDVTDLVFIDPVGTGLSRPLGGKDGTDHWGLMEDGRSVSQFVRTWLAENNRWNSPKFIFGESYGTPRAAIMSDILTNQMGISLNGIVMISAILDWQYSRPTHGGLMYYVSTMPTMAATSYYHNALPNKPANLEAFLAEVREYSRTKYLTALAQGQSISASERAAVIDKLHEYTGLKKSFLEDTDMRVTSGRYYKEILRDRSLAVGRVDSRYLIKEMEDAGERYETDPFNAAVQNAFGTSINDHLQNFLNVKLTDRIYNLSGRNMDKWTWNWKIGNSSGGNKQFTNTIPYLGRAMRRNPDMKILVPTGYFDFATVFFGAENAFAQRGIPQDRVQFSYFESGHMMYLHDESRTKFLNDIREFVKAGH
jgi:carboxypeptidase C (cathepsin A)